MQKPLLLILLSLLIACRLCIPQQDIVVQIFPSYTHRWFSGYLQFNTGRYHYVFFQSQSDPKNDPVVLWLNGGPGCSSLFGMLYQNGPFVFSENSHNMYLNQFAWNKIANVLYIQSPGGTGFSESFRNDTYSDITATDDNIKALLKFYEKFPSYKPNPLFITGQSYAGVFIPFLSRAILTYNLLPSRYLTFNFKGFMINNPCTDHRQCYQPRIVHSNSVYQYQYLYNHGYYTEDEYLDMRAVCILGYYSEECEQVRKYLDSKFQKTNSSIYHIYLPCFYQKTLQQFKYTHSGGRLSMADGYHCDDTQGYETFLNKPTTHELLHVDAKLFTDCRPSVATRYQKTPEQSYPLYESLVKQKIRILIVSGDHDADVPITGTLTWIKRLRQEANLPVEQPWRQWWVRGIHKNDDQVAGMTWKLRGLTFASVKGAGHMVPKDKHKEAFTLFNSFIRGTALPYKDQ